jgi:thiol-disulfide isomerase/thioredoxin
MAVLELTADTFNDAIAADKTVIIDFWAPWCGPCRSFAPTFEAAAAKHTDVVFAKINTGNEALTKATIHYNASVSDLGLTEEFSLLSLLGL